MNNTEELEKIIDEKLKPYEEKMKNLEELAESKDEEINKLKGYIFDFHKILEQIESMDLPL